MNIAKLTDDEICIVKECLKASLDGPFFPDWEYETLIGAKKSEIEKIIQGLPNIHENKYDITQVICSCLGNLIGYPHGREDEWEKYVSANYNDVLNIIAKLKQH